MVRFTVEKSKWYAMDYIHNDFKNQSPIFIFEFKPRNSGNSEFYLKFFHASYSDGVQSKSYELQTKLRNNFLLIAERLDYDEIPLARPVLIISELKTDWLKRYFPQVRWKSPKKSDAQAMMFDEYPRVIRMND